MKSIIMLLVSYTAPVQNPFPIPLWITSSASAILEAISGEFRFEEIRQFCSLHCPLPYNIMAIGYSHFLK